MAEIDGMPSDLFNCFVVHHEHVVRQCLYWPQQYWAALPPHEGLDCCQLYTQKFTVEFRSLD